MRIVLFPLLLALLPVSLPAQLDDILKNPNVTWAATFETEHDFRLNPKQEGASIQLLKFTYPEEGCVDFINDNWLTHWILKGMADGKFKASDDPALSVWVAQTTLMNRITSIDTVITFDPATYEERMQVIRNDLNGDDIIGFRTYEVIFYDKKTGSFETRLLALAPLVTQTDPTGKVVSKSPVAWLAIDGRMPGNFSLQNPDIIWSALLIDKANDLEISQLKVLKNEWKQPFTAQFHLEALGMKHPVERSKGFGCGKLLSKKDIDNLYTSIDTVTTLDPVTFKETIKIIKNDVRPSDLQKIRLVQEWYYDKRRNVLFNKLKAVSPLVDKFDESGKKLRYALPMYYLRF